MDSRGLLNEAGSEPNRFHKLRAKAEYYHERTPFLRRLPGSAIAIILLIGALNIVVWVACGIVLSFNTGLVTTGVLSYTLGLRLPLMQIILQPST